MKSRLSPELDYTLCRRSWNSFVATRRPSLDLVDLTTGLPSSTESSDASQLDS
jgi:hypothetical protein